MTATTLISWTLDPCKWTKGHRVMEADLARPGPTRTLCGVRVPQVLFNIEIGPGADHEGTCKRCHRQKDD
jgi:hypothetical protein